MKKTKLTVGAAKLRSWREQREYTQAKLGDFLGLTAQYISMLESGDRRPGLDLMFNLRELCNISPDDWERK